jgi:hypothetical protein
MKKRLALLGAGTAAVLGAMMPMSGAAVAAAPTLPDGVEVVYNATAVECPPGNFCSYTGPYQTGTMYKTAVNWSGTLSGIRSYFNRGEYHPGYDHVDLTWVGGGPKCIHYYESGGATPYKGTFASSKTITKVKWRGEC